LTEDIAYSTTEDTINDTTEYTTAYLTVDIAYSTTEDTINDTTEVQKAMSTVKYSVVS
jgi:hypothetical protein